MRYPAAEKLEIIQLVEQSHLPVQRVLEQIGIPRSTFYRWCDLYQTGGPEALDDRSPRPDRVWNRIPDDVRARIVTLALDEPELSPRELAVRFTDAERYFVSEASVYRLLKAHDLITSPAFIVMKAADEFKNKTTAPDQLWQTDFTYLKVTGWGWFYLSTVLDDFSRYIVAWKLCTTMKAEDVTDTLELALQASGLDQVNVAHRPRLLSDNGPSYVSVELAAWLDKQDMPHIRGAPYHPMTQGKIERWALIGFPGPTSLWGCGPELNLKLLASYGPSVDRVTIGLEPCIISWLPHDLNLHVVRPLNLVSLREAEMRVIHKAQFELSVDGVPRSYRDRKDLALQAARF